MKTGHDFEMHRPDDRRGVKGLTYNEEMLAEHRYKTSTFNPVP